VRLNRELEAMTDAATAAATAILARADVETYRNVFATDGRVLTSILIGARYRAKAATEAAMTATLLRATGTVVSPVVVPYEAVKFTRTGLDTGALLARTPGLIEAKIAAGTAPEVAVQQGVNLARSLVASEAFRVNRCTVEEATATDPRFIGWVRVAEGDACDFCEMLASRGAVYTSDSTAVGDGLGYHNNCRCYAEEVVDRSVARAIARDGEAAWAQQVSEGRLPRVAGGGRSDLAAVGLNESADVLRARVAFYEQMASERSNLPGRRNYAESNAEKARRALERALLRTP
jgi:hypothetical protein